MIHNIITDITKNTNINEILIHSKSEYSDKVDTVIVMATYNRLDFLQKTITSLSNTNLDNTLLIIIDDKSNDDVINYLKGLSIKNIPQLTIFKKENKNMFDSFKLVFDACLSEENLKYFIIMDSDTIHKYDWLNKEKDLFNEKNNENEKCIVTGFNTLSHPHTIVDNKYCKKKTIGGINILFNKDFYINILRDTLINSDWDWTMSYKCSASNYNIYCTIPSVIQHIGNHYSTRGGYNAYGDVAHDY